MRTIYYATVQKNDLQSSDIHKKHNRSPYIVLIRLDIAFKDCMSCLGAYTRPHGTSTEHLGQINSSVVSSSLKDILIVNALEQKHSQRQSEVNKTLFFTSLSLSLSLPQEAILKIFNNKHSYHEYILPIS